MKKYILLLTCFCLCTKLFAQYEVTIDAVVLDNDTKQPIPYVNIEFIGTDVKTISDSDGRFTLVYDELRIVESNIFKCAAFGYNVVKVEASELFKLLKNTDKIFLVSSFNLVNSPVQFQKSQPLESRGNVYGTISSQSEPIQMATVRVKNTYTEAHTDVEGNYYINAKEDDILVVNYLGMLVNETQVGSKNNINITLEPDGELLEEVIIEGQVKKEEKIDLGLSGNKNLDAIGFDVKIMTNEDIKPNYYSFEDLLSRKFANVYAKQDPLTGNTLISIRRGGSYSNNKGALIDLDGGIYDGDVGIPPIDVQNVASIVIIKSLAGVTKYGEQGSGGVVVIRTKTFVGKDHVEPVKSLFVDNNDYEETLALPVLTTKKDAYTQELEKASSFNEALTIYKRQKSQSKQLTVPYFVKTSNYFRKWDKDYALNILFSIGCLAYDNAKALKTLAYTLELEGKLEDAKQIYQRIATIQPKAAQSYRDLALIYKETGYYSKAMELYGQMLNNNIEGVDFSDLQEVVTNELKHLLAKYRSKVDYRNVHADFLQTNFKYDIRIVFEWNDANTEFEVQFVNPKKKFFKWSQTKFENRAKMLDGITKGYHTEEFIIDDDEQGEWIINIESLNKEPPLNPTYLKYTVYRNYGLVNETKEVKVISLNNCNPKVTLDKLFSR